MPKLNLVKSKANFAKQTEEYYKCHSHKYSIFRCSDESDYY